jgi:hypothetical protein
MPAAALILYIYMRYENIAAEARSPAVFTCVPVQRELTPGGPGSGLRPGRKRFLCQLPLWFYIYVCVGTARADSRRSGVGIAPRPQALPMPATALVLYALPMPAAVHAALILYIFMSQDEPQITIRLGGNLRGFEATGQFG